MQLTQLNAARGEHGAKTICVARRSRRILLTHGHHDLLRRETTLILSCLAARICALDLAWTLLRSRAPHNIADQPEHAWLRYCDWPHCLRKPIRFTKVSTWPLPPRAPADIKCVHCAMPSKSASIEAHTSCQSATILNSCSSVCVASHSRLEDGTWSHDHQVVGIRCNRSVSCNLQSS